MGQYLVTTLSILFLTLCFSWNEHTHAGKPQAAPAPQVEGYVSTPSKAYFEDLKGMHGALDPKHEIFSLLYSFALLEQRVLANMRFYGNYGVDFKTDGGIDQKKQLELKDEYDVPHDPIAAVIQWLFPSPDGQNFVPNERRNDPIGMIAIEENASELGLGILRVGDIIKAIIGYKDDKTFLDAVKVALAGGGSEQRTKLNKFVPQFLAALKMDGTIGGKPATTLYPPHITVYALMAYTWKVSNSKARVIACLDRGGVLNTTVDQKALAQERFTKEDFLNLQKTLSENELTLAQSMPVPELLTLIGYGTEFYMGQGPRIIAYSGNVSIPPQCDKKGTFPDCGETSWRNVLNALLFVDGAYHPERLLHLPKNIYTAPGIQRIMHFYRSATPTTDSNLTQHSAWAAAINVPIGSDRADLRNQVYHACYNLTNGLFGMLNFLGHLMPDDVLNEPWIGTLSTWKTEPQNFIIAARKLDRVMELLSMIYGKKLDWAQVVSKDKIIKSNSIDIVVKLADPQVEESLFTWALHDGHFYVNNKISENLWFNQKPVMQSLNVLAAQFENKILFNSWFQAFKPARGTESLFAYFFGGFLSDGIRSQMATALHLEDYEASNPTMASTLIRIMINGVHRLLMIEDEYAKEQRFEIYEYLLPAPKPAFPFTLTYWPLWRHLYVHEQFENIKKYMPSYMMKIWSGDIDYAPLMLPPDKLVYSQAVQKYLNLLILKIAPAKLISIEQKPDKTWGLELHLMENYETTWHSLTNIWVKSGDSLKGMKGYDDFVAVMAAAVQEVAQKNVLTEYRQGEVLQASLSLKAWPIVKACLSFTALTVADFADVMNQAYAAGQHDIVDLALSKITRPDFYRVLYGASRLSPEVSALLRAHQDQLLAAAQEHQGVKAMSVPTSLKPSLSDNAEG